MAKKTCNTCRYTSVSLHDEPCESCVKDVEGRWSEWEPDVGAPDVPRTHECVDEEVGSDTRRSPVTCADGLTKREWFAGQAIGAVIKQCCRDSADALEGRSIEQYFAEKAFAVADAMLKAGEG